MRLRNVLFSLMLVVLLVGPSCLAVAGLCGIAGYPTWLSTEDAKFLSGGEADADVASEMSWEGFASGELQKALEGAVGNHIPAKAIALFTNARLQHEAIAASNMLFGWDCIPSFYGSSLLDVLPDQRLAERPEPATPVLMSKIDAMVLAHEEFALRHKDIDTYLYFGPDSLNVDGAPAAKLMSNPLTYQMLRERFDKDDSLYTWIDGGLPYDEFKEKWYKTDHHWTIEGAFEAYQRIAKAMGHNPMALGGGVDCLQ
ncbi:hypothetical protein VJ923_09050 [Adlercreutzia sp. R25]|uniref:hypothetical protein n=1 Tax=Adlercreutzia shanghongiae TaxID=3111773 RepID=UPI002DBED6F9|nr:hypothetical protein [Adlercreutzia sp. R25]MEC4273303.1 hypothetical protein [Adlercreutzia sp. R25]